MITTLTIVQGNLPTITCLLTFLQDRYFRIYNSTFFKQKENVRTYIAPLFYFSYGHSGKHLVIFAWECLEKFHLKRKKKEESMGNESDLEKVKKICIYSQLEKSGGNWCQEFHQLPCEWNVTFHSLNE